MIKKAMEYVSELTRPTIFTVNERKFADKPLIPIDREPKAECIRLTTLSSLVDYIKSGLDFYESYIIHITSPTTVAVYSALDADRRREHIVTVEAQLPSFRFGSYIEHEEFCIALQSKFMQNDNRALLLRFAGTVEDGSVAEYGDDGITQKATVKTGIASKTDVIVPNPVSLVPYRTFLEVAQPASEFLFRMSNKGGVQCALFEADGGAWKIEAMASIKQYLAEALAEYNETHGYNFIIIS